MVNIKEKYLSVTVPGGWQQVQQITAAGGQVITTLLAVTPGQAIVLLRQPEMVADTAGVDEHQPICPTPNQAAFETASERL